MTQEAFARSAASSGKNRLTCQGQPVPGSPVQTGWAARLLASGSYLAATGIVSAALVISGPAQADLSQADLSGSSAAPDQVVAAIAWDSDVPMGFDTLNIELGGSITRQPAAVASSKVTAPQAAQGPAKAHSWVDSYNYGMLRLNQGLYDAYMAAYETVVGPADPNAPPRDPAKVGSLGNVMLNLFNEPLTVVSSALIGDLPNSANAASRFAMNSTLGVLGWWDVASARGYTPKYTDLGLTLCKYGVGEGPYLVLPLVGPRTMRDAFADLAWSSTLTWSALGPGASQTTVQAGAVVEQTTSLVLPVSVSADIMASRYFDPVARRIMSTDPDMVRERYLAQRRLRCAS